MLSLVCRSVCNRQNNGLKNVHILIPGTCDYATSHGGGDGEGEGGREKVKIAYEIKIADRLTLRWGD